MPRAMGVRTSLERTWRLEPGSTISGLHFGGAGPAVQTAGNWSAPGEDAAVPHYGPGVRYFGGSTWPGHKRTDLLNWWRAHCDDHQFVLVYNRLAELNSTDMLR